MLGFPEAEISPGVFLLDDLNFDYTGFQQQALLLNAIESAMDGPPPLPGEGEPGSGGTNSIDTAGARTLCGTCSGHLITPVYQVTNLVLTLTGVTNTETYELYSTPSLSQTNWTALGIWTNPAAPWVINDPPTNESYYVVGCVRDTDHERLSDMYEVFQSHSDPCDPDTDYDGRSDYEEWLEEGTDRLDAKSFTPMRLGYFRFNDAAFAGSHGQTNIATNALQWVEAWITKGVQLTNSAARLIYQTVETNDGTANINLRSGSVRFWFKPTWTSGGVGAPGEGARFLEVGRPNSTGWWAFYLESSASTVAFVSQTNGASVVTNLTASVSFTSNRWSQLTLTYTNGAVALFTNGVLCASNSASLPYPGLEVRTNGFGLGCAYDGGSVAHGLFEDLETFNYPLSANDVLENFQLTQPPMLIPNLLVWLKADSGAVTNVFGQVDPWLDQSGNRNNASQALAGSRPLFVGDSAGGRPAIYFPGTNSIYLNISNSLFSSVTEAEAFMVMRAQTNKPSVLRALWLMGVNTYYLSTDGNIKESFGAGTLVNAGFPAQRVDEAHIYGAVAASNEWTLRLNGVVHYTQNTNTVVFSTGPRLGDGGSGNSFEGYISEVLVLGRRLTEIERMAVQNYLAQRYNLVGSPPPAPSGLQVFAISTNQISLTWSNALSNTNVSFLVQRRSGTGPYSTVAVLANSLSHVDSGLAPNTPYSYRIKAVNFAGESGFSVETNLSTLSSGIALPYDALTIWLKGDAGHGGSPVNCWQDQTTNNYSAFFKYGGSPKQPLWFADALNGRSALGFFGTNGYSIRKFTTGWTQGEVVVVLKSLGVSSNEYSALWLMSSSALPSWHPAPTGSVWEHFGRSDGATDTGVPAISLTTPHVYRVAAASNSFTTWLNTSVHYSTGVNQVGFAEDPAFGWGPNGSMFRGYIAEAMFFNRLLNTEERNTVISSYLRRRYNLW